MIRFSRFLNCVPVESKLQNPEKPWESVSAAAGYALFGPAVDADMESVFKRADELMYEQKKKMKAQRA